MIRLDRVTKRFGAFDALKSIDLDVREREFLALLGPSGSGKTTLLRLIAGLAFPDSGRVLFGDRDVTGLPVARREVGFVFQHYALFKHMKVAENIGFGLSVRPRKSRPGKTEIRRCALELLELVQLGGLGNRFPAQLSGGQRQRVALARALAVEPRVLLLDEPFGALDAKVRKDLRRWLRHLHEEMGLTSIFVTHDQEEALELADRLVVLDHGAIEQIGTPEDIYMRPATPFVSDFVGDTNSLPVTIREGMAFLAGKPVFACPHLAFAEGQATLDFRPHDAVAAGPDTPAATAIVGTAYRKGGVWRVEARMEGIDAPVEIDVDGALPRPEPGARLRIAIARAQIFPGRVRAA